MNQFEEQAILERILDAFEGIEDYRTVGGIARSTGLEAGLVRGFVLSHMTEFEEATVRLGGEPVYRPRARVRPRNQVAI